MKRITLVGTVVVLALVRSAMGDMVIYNNSSTPFGGGVIPDGSLVGTAFSQTLTGLPALPISDVNVSLTLSSGWNGNLYAYLVHGDGFAVLLNRVGRGTINDGTSAGYGTAGMNVMLSDGGADIHWVASPSGTLAPDGRNISPLSTVASFNAAPTLTLNDAFGGGNANGTWTLFLADVSGGAQSTLNSWSLEIAAVPEPASLIEGSVAVLFLGGVVWVYRRKAAKQQPQAC